MKLFGRSGFALWALLSAVILGCSQSDIDKAMGKKDNSNKDACNAALAVYYNCVYTYGSTYSNCMTLQSAAVAVCAGGSSTGGGGGGY